MSKFNFKSAICTDRNQSERLLALGLKKETADMHWAYHSVTATRYMVAHPCDGVGECIPAWSLHRLLEMNLNSTDTRFEVRFNQLDVKDAYEILLAHIEWLIKEGYFNKEYLE